MSDSLSESMLIDCSVSPMITGRSIRPENQISSAFHGQMVWDSTKIELFLAEEQKVEPWIKGHDLKKKLEGKVVLPANVLDWLLQPENQHHIPVSWAGKATFFWGTIYRDSGRYAVVRFLNWYGRSWGWDDYWLGHKFRSCYPAALAS